jgi:hypothetical protein
MLSLILHIKSDPELFCNRFQDTQDVDYLLVAKRFRQNLCPENQVTSALCL